MNQCSISELVETGEAAAYVSLFEHAPQEYGLQIRRVGGARLLLAPWLPMILFNRVIGLGIQQVASEGMLEEILGLYQEARIQNFAIQTSPFAQPEELKHWLLERGFLHGGNWAKVYRRPSMEVEVSSDFRLEHIGSAQAEAFAQVTIAGFGMPPLMVPFTASSVGQPGWSHYLAFQGDTPVGGAALFVRGKVGWMGIGSTHPDFRRRGGQGALMARRIRDAASMGLEWVITETGEDTPESPNPSYHNMVRTGFQLAYLRPNYVYRGKP